MFKFPTPCKQNQSKFRHTWIWAMKHWWKRLNLVLFVVANCVITTNKIMGMYCKFDILCTNYTNHRFSWSTGPLHTLLMSSATLWRGMHPNKFIRFFQSTFLSSNNESIQICKVHMSFPQYTMFGKCIKRQ